MADELTVIGVNLPRPNAMPLVTGAGMFLRDMKFPGMLRTRILRSPHAHANITSIDTSKAEAMPGVAAVLTHKNIPADWPGATGYGKGKHIRILNQKVRFVGDPVAVVAAETQDIADSAAKLIEVKYETLPAVFTMEDALKEEAPQLHEIYPGNVIAESAYEYGDVDTGFAESDKIVEASSSLIAAIPSVNFVEDCGTVAWWEGDKVTVVRTTQNSPSTLTKVTDFTGMPITNVRVMSARFVGGSGNIKENALKDLEFAVTLAKITGRKVGIFLSKEESFLQYHKERLSAQYKIGVKNDGTLMAIEGSVTGDASSYNYTAAAAYGASQLCWVAYSPNLRFNDIKTAFTNNPPGGGCRGWIYQEAEWTFMPALQKAMEAIDIDPFDFYMKNTLKMGDRYYFNGEVTCDCEPVVNAASEAAAVFDWKNRWKGWKKPTSTSGSKVRAIGIGWGGNGSSNNTNYTATVALSSNGTISITPSEDEMGNGNRTNPWRNVAEVLKVPLNSVKGPPGDTDAQPFYAWTVACGTFAIGRAVKRAAEDARRQLLEMAAPKMGVTAEELDTKDRVVFVKADTGKRMAWNLVISNNCSIVGTGENIMEKGRYPEIQCAMVEVEIDTETGSMDITDVVHAGDVGKIVSPGDCAQQAVWSLVNDGNREAYVCDTATGRVLNPNYLDMKCCTFAELPNFQAVLTETPSEEAPYGARAMAETVAVPVTPAVIMAIYNATGTMMELPVTPAKILAALGKA